MDTQARPTNDAAAEGGALLTPLDVCRRLSVCKATLYRMIRRGEFPRPFKVGFQSRWRPDAVAAWIAEQEERQNAA